MLLDQLKEKGIELELDGDNVRVRAQGAMTEEQRAFLREKKKELRAELRSREELPEHIKGRLHNVVAKITADCVSWYRDDAEILEQMNETDLEKMAVEYIAARDWFRRGVRKSR